MPGSMASRLSWMAPTLTIPAITAPGAKPPAPTTSAARCWRPGFTKAEIRQLSKELGLPNWDKPAAACLSSRIPYGTPITLAALSQVERAEALLHGLGLRQLRVRHHGPVARIQAEPGDFACLLEHRDEIVAASKAIGYMYVSLDLAGFRSGSLNDALSRTGAQAGE